MSSRRATIWTFLAWIAVASYTYKLGGATATIMASVPMLWAGIFFIIREWPEPPEPPIPVAKAKRR